MSEQEARKPKRRGRPPKTVTSTDENDVTFGRRVVRPEWHPADPRTHFWQSGPNGMRLILSPRELRRLRAKAERERTTLREVIMAEIRAHKLP